MSFCLFIFCSPYSRNFSPATGQTTTGMSSYLPIMSPGLDQQQQIMWPTSGQTDEFLAARGGKLPEFHRFTTSSFVNQTKNSHYNSFSPQVRTLSINHCTTFNKYFLFYRPIGILTCHQRH